MKELYKICIISAFVFLTSCATHLPWDYLPHRVSDVEAGQVVEFAEYAVLSDYSYHNPERIQFVISHFGWTHVGVLGQPTSAPTYINKKSGFACDILEHSDGVRTVIAYRGTDEELDWVTANAALFKSAQYKQAHEVYQAYHTAHPNRVVTATGHSLGGGLALGVSVREGVDAIVYDTSPRVFDGWGGHHEPARRVVVYEHKEILQEARANWKKIWDVVDVEDFYVTQYKFGSTRIALHSGTKLDVRCGIRGARCGVIKISRNPNLETRYSPPLTSVFVGR